MLREHGGRLRASIDSPEVVEGRRERDPIVLRSFADRSAYEAWASSEADPRIARDRSAATEGPVLLVRGIG